MKITEIHYPDGRYEGMYEGVKVVLLTNEGSKFVQFSEGEPEDMNINRDLSDVWVISTMLEMAYNAGKNGETLEIESVKEEAIKIDYSALGQ